MSDEPIFEVRTPAGVYKIWSDGRIGGFPPGASVVNRIGGVMRQREAALLTQKGVGARRISIFDCTYTSYMGPRGQVDIATYSPTGARFERNSFDEDFDHFRARVEAALNGSPVTDVAPLSVGG